MTDPTNGCLERSRPKTASATIYLMEELGDARLRCDQLVRYLDEAVQLVEKAPKKDLLFEVAGHLIKSIPDTAFKLQKALQAVALAADRLDYEELKQELRPEKVEELERVLQEARIRTVPHRSETNMNPKQAAEALREIVQIARTEGSVPVYEVAEFLTRLDPPGVTAAQERSGADKLEKLAEMLEDPNQDPLSRVRLAAIIRRIAMESTIDDAIRLADAQQQQDEVQDKQAFTDAPSVPALFESIKDKALVAMRAANSKRWRPALLNLSFIVDDIGTILVQMGSMDTMKSEALKREIRQVLPHAADALETAPSMPMFASEGPAWDVEATEEKLTKFEEGKPADPTENMDADEAKKWKENTDEYGDKFKSAGGVEDSFVRRLKKHEKEIGLGDLSKKMKESDWKETLHKAVAKLFVVEGKGKYTKEDAERKSKDWVKPSMLEELKSGLIKTARFQEGVSADPTKNMSPEDAKSWEEMNDEHKDNFKSASLIWKA